MDLLQWQQTDKNQFATFIRDLTTNLNNVKHMIEDSYTQPVTKHHKKGKQGKKVIKKKKDIIIERQTKIRTEKLETEDLSTLDYLLENLDLKNPYPVFALMKTAKGLHELKFRMLHHFWQLRKEYFPHVMNLYFQLVNKECSDDQQRLMDKIGSTLDDTEYKLYMMTNLSHLLPPLNIHEPRVKKLDEWQLTVINHIKNKESVLVKAPTSAGKSFVGLGAGVLHKKILYVCPAKPIAYQVGAHFTLMGYKVHYLLDNVCYQGYDDKTTIFVGVPTTVEDNLYKLGVSFDYAVFDEIHNLNKEDDGHIYENIIKMIRCPFVALSATIGNIEFLRQIFKGIHDREIHYVEYTKRFINQQKMIYKSGALHKLHPLSCISCEDLNESFLKKNLQFTPYDSATLWQTMEEIFEEADLDEIVEDYSPDNYFDEHQSILTLDDTRDYEVFIKGKLVELSSTHPTEVTKILDTFREDGATATAPTDVAKDIIQLFRECKRNECLPMLAFNTDTVTCKKTFTELFTKISLAELDEYPYHYDILAKKDELYTKYEEARERFIDGIKISKGSKDASTDKETKVNRYDSNEQAKYVQNVLSYYDTCIHNVERSDTSADTKKRQIKNLQREKVYYHTYPSFSHIDVFQKHKAFCFTNTDPMTGDQIRTIRREIKKTLGIKISYEHELFQMLKRGIGIYTEDMPDEYKWVLQKLMDDKKIGIVISDRTLCLGIDLPIRSSLLLGLPGSSTFTTDDYLQMSGRAGRRGKDDRGYTIFYNLDYKQLMKGELPDIIGSDKAVPSNYRCFQGSTDEVYEDPIHKDKRIDTQEYQASLLPKLQWSLRYEVSVPEFIVAIPKWNKEVFRCVEDMDKELCVLEGLSQMLLYDSDMLRSSYKRKLIGSAFGEWKHVIQVLQTIYNSLRDKKYTHLKGVMTNVHSACKDMILKYQGLS